MPRPQLPPPPDRMRPLIGNPFLLLPASSRFRRAPSWLKTHDDPATRLVYRVAWKSLGLPFDVAQWALTAWIAQYIFADQTGPKVSPMAVMAFAWFWGRMTAGAMMLTWRGVWRVLKAMGRLLAPAPAARDH